MTTKETIEKLRGATAILETIPCTGSVTMSRMLMAEQLVGEVIKDLQASEIEGAKPPKE